MSIAAALLEIPGEQGQEDNLEALQQAKQGQHIPEEQVALYMKFTIAILPDWQITPFSLLVQDIIKKVEDDHVVGREQLQRLLYLGGILLHDCLIRMTSSNCTDSDLEASVQDWLFP